MTNKWFRSCALLLALLLSPLAKADDWLGEYVMVPNERMPQLYDANGQAQTLVTIVKRGEEYGLVSKQFGWEDPVPTKLETTGQALRDWLMNDASTVKSQALVGDKIALIKLAKGSVLNAANGRSHEMHSDYLLIISMMGMDVELEKKPATP
ncbi:hypothetical protein [Aquitalea aquatilis]|uniref:hypothetical protein n=1 Tax=Aquitalea aquatilis TaxID=1537400 RepID=UPI0010BCEE85|nr:hypothetical protein [Aquitalea aquatilis]